MHILVDISHPAHVHFFRNALNLWEKRGHRVSIVSRDKDITLELLDKYGYQHTCLSKARKGILGLAFELLEHEGKLYWMMRNDPPDIFLEIAGTFIVHAAKLLKKPSVVFYDTENATISNAITYPIATAICTPSCYQGRVGKGHITYSGYHELAYLHPARFQPDPEIINKLKIPQDKPYTIVRFVNWEAGHDVAQKGFSLQGKIRLINELNSFGPVFITSEAPLPRELEGFRFPLSSSLIHQAISFSSLYVGESATMASECCILGVPAIFVSPVGRGYTDEQEKEYGLCYTISDKEEDKAIFLALELMRNKSKEQWPMKRAKMLQEKVDVTQWMVQFVEELVKKDGDLEKVREIMRSFHG